MRHMRRDSTEEDTAAPVCAVAVAVRRNCTHCEDSQQLRKEGLSPADHWAHSLVASNQHVGKLEQPRQQSWCFYWKHPERKLNHHTVQHWEGPHTKLERNGFCTTPQSSNAPSASGASLKTQWMVLFSRPHNTAAKALHLLQGAPETGDPYLPLFLQLAKKIWFSIQVWGGLLS